MIYFALALLQVCPSQEAKLLASDGVAFANFGSASYSSSTDHGVALQGRRLVVGAPNQIHPVTGFRLGEAYLFEFAAGVWSETAQFYPSGPSLPATSLFDFGHSVALDQDTVLITALYGTPSSNGQDGLAYVFRETGTGWIQDAVLDPGDPDEVDFGSTAAVQGDRIVISDPRNIDQGQAEGAVFVFERVSGSWIMKAKVRASDGAAGDRFGQVLALDGNTLFVGSPYADGAAGDSGAVYVFQGGGATWVEQAKVFAADGKPNDQFGWALAHEGGTLAITAVWIDFNGQTDCGGAYVFVGGGSTWAQQAKLVTHGYEAQQWTGISVDVEGDLVAISAPAELFEPGAVYLYGRRGATWSEGYKFRPADAGNPDNFGRSIELDGARLVAASPFHDALGTDSGAAYVFQIQGSPSGINNFYCTAKQSSVGCIPRIYHVGIPSVSGAAAGGQYMIHAWEIVSYAPGMLMYSTQGPGSTPFGGGLLCMSQPVHRTTLQVSYGDTSPCPGSFAFDFNAWIASGQDPALVSGQPVWLQLWYRDGGYTPPNAVGLTDAISATICP